MRTFEGYTFNPLTITTVSNNNLTNNGYGVYLDNSSNNTISNNVATYEKGMPDGSVLGDGIFMDNSASNTIANNDLSNNHVFGISLYESPDNTIISNVIAVNEQFGIRLRQSSNNTLVFNTIRANVHQGIYIGDALGNMIYLNNFSARATTSATSRARSSIQQIRWCRLQRHHANGVYGQLLFGLCWH